MHQSTSQVKDLLHGTLLEGAAVSEWWPFDSRQNVLLVELQPSTALQSWAILRSLVPVTGRYPVIATLTDIDMNFQERQPLESELYPGDPQQEVIAAARLIDGHTELAAHRMSRGDSPTVTTGLFDWMYVPIDHWNHELGKMLERFGAYPSVEEIHALRRDNVLRTDVDLERWLLRWEIEHFGEAAITSPHSSNFDWRAFDDPAGYVAVLLPTPHSWEGIAYMGWWGAIDRRVETAAAMRNWQERYGAELVCSFTTTLELQVSRRPATLDEAFDLAIEHTHFAPDATLLGGISLRDYARSLYALDHWWLWCKP